MVREKPNDMLPINILAWIGVFQVGRYTYWLDLRRNGKTIATTDKLEGDTYRADTVRILSNSTHEVVVEYDGENGESTFTWKYR